MCIHILTKIFSNPIRAMMLKASVEHDPLYIPMRSFHDIHMGLFIIPYGSIGTLPSQHWNWSPVIA